MYTISLQKTAPLVADCWILPTPDITTSFCRYFCFSIQQLAVSHQCALSLATVNMTLLFISVDPHSVIFIVMVIVIVLGVDSPVCSHLHCAMKPTYLRIFNSLSSKMILQNNICMLQLQYCQTFPCLSWGTGRLQSKNKLQTELFGVNPGLWSQHPALCTPDWWTVSLERSVIITTKNDGQSCKNVTQVNEQCTGIILIHLHNNTNTFLVHASC